MEKEYRKIKIITDSCCDINEELMKQYDIDYVKMSVVNDGSLIEASMNWSNEDYHKFYDLIRSGKRITTAQVKKEEFETVFSKYINNGYDVIYLACSSKQSSSVHTGALVAKNMCEENPEAKITAIDSLNSSTSLGMLAIEASKLVQKNIPYDEVVKQIYAMRKKVNEFCTVHSLEYLRRAGRVKGSTAFFGNLMGVKPIIISDAEGNQSAFKKVKGRQNSFKELVSLLKEAIVNPEEQIIYLSHADCKKEEVDQLVSLIKSEISCKEVYIGYIGPIVGASVGPDAIAVFAFGKEVLFTVK